MAAHVTITPNGGTHYLVDGISLYMPPPPPDGASRAERRTYELYKRRWDKKMAKLNRRDA